MCFPSSRAIHNYKVSRGTDPTPWDETNPAYVQCLLERLIITAGSPTTPSMASVMCASLTQTKGSQERPDCSEHTAPVSSTMNSSSTANSSMSSVSAINTTTPNSPTMVSLAAATNSLSVSTMPSAEAEFTLKETCSEVPDDWEDVASNGGTGALYAAPNISEETSTATSLSTPKSAVPFSSYH